MQLAIASAPPQQVDRPSTRMTLPDASAATSVDAIGDSPTSRGFAALLGAFRATGGTARGDDVARLLEDHRLGDFISLAKLISGRQVFGFEWRSTLWIAMFPFDLGDLSVKPAAQQVLLELGADFNDWRCAAWFARPNAWLDGRAPVDLIAARLPDVLEAARADRLIAAA